MRSSLFRRVVGLMLSLAMLLILLPGTAVAGTTSVLTTSMTGAEEAPGPGDPDGFGIAVIILKPASGTVCWVYVVKRVEPIAAAHIHLAPAGSPGPVVVPLGIPRKGGVSIGCTTADPALVGAIVADPSAYYINVHNAPFPAGALRGQLD